jgi:polysaccharide export outer membrane protein
MMHLLFRPLWRNWPLGVPMVAIAVVTLVSGCASRVYRPTTLPAQFAASPAVDLDTLNLSGLAGTSNSNDMICWGDLLTVEIDAGLPSLPPRVSDVRVAKDGTTKIPLIGRVLVAGLEVERAEAAIATAARARDVYPNPFVSVRITQPRKNDITVVGAVASPGVYGLSRGSSSLMGALIKAGGLADTASGEIEIRHTDPRLAVSSPRQPATAADSAHPTQLVSHETPLVPTDGVARVNLFDAAANGAGNHPLQDGDVINVIQRELPPIHVLGLVTKPGEFEMTANRDVYLLDALALAGGCSSPVADRVTVRRRVSGEAGNVTIVASIRKAMDGQDNVLLAPGDTVMVRQTPQTVVVDVFKSFIRLSLGSSVALF